MCIAPRVRSLYLWKGQTYNTEDRQACIGKLLRVAPQSHTHSHKTHTHTDTHADVQIRCCGVPKRNETHRLQYFLKIFLGCRFFAVFLFVVLCLCMCVSWCAVISGVAVQ